jgi:hypothetical protein
VIAGMDAWKDADLPIANGEEPGTAELLVQERLVRNFVSIYKIDFQTRRLGVQQ